MTVHRDFKTFLTNIQIKNAGQIGLRYESIIRSLNLHFCNSGSKTTNGLQVGAYGRFTGIDGIADLDILYIMPQHLWATYQNDPSDLLDTCKKQIEKAYSKTDIEKKRNVITISFCHFAIDLMPVFKTSDGKFFYPDINGDAGWLICDPIAELTAFKHKDKQSNGNLTQLAKMVRAWQTKHSIVMSDFLIDTLCYRFFDQNTKFNRASFDKYDELVSDFFKFLSIEPAREYYLAFGSNLHVEVAVEKKLQLMAAQAQERCLEALIAKEAGKDEECNRQYKYIFGKHFPKHLVIPQGKVEKVCIENSNELSDKNSEKLANDTTNVQNEVKAAVEKKPQAKNKPRVENRPVAEKKARGKKKSSVINKTSEQKKALVEKKQLAEKKRLAEKKQLVEKKQLAEKKRLMENKSPKANNLQRVNSNQSSSPNTKSVIPEETMPDEMYYDASVKKKKTYWLYFWNIILAVVVFLLLRQ